MYTNNLFCVINIYRIIGLILEVTKQKNTYLHKCLYLHIQVNIMITLFLSSQHLLKFLNDGTRVGLAEKCTLYSFKNLSSV